MHSKNTQWPHWRVPGCRRDSIYEKTSRLHSVCLFAFVITVWQPLLPSPSSHPPMPQSKYNFIRFFICSYPVQTQSRSGSFDFRLTGGNWALHIDLIPQRRHPFFVTVTFRSLESETPEPEIPHLLQSWKRSHHVSIFLQLFHLVNHLTLSWLPPPASQLSLHQCRRKKKLLLNAFQKPPCPPGPHSLYWRCLCFFEQKAMIFTPHFSCMDFQLPLPSLLSQSLCFFYRMLRSSQLPLSLCPLDFAKWQFLPHPTHPRLVSSRQMSWLGGKSFVILCKIF